eukprot:765762-Hanusia_phi.AAC.7
MRGEGERTQEQGSRVMYRRETDVGDKARTRTSVGKGTASLGGPQLAGAEADPLAGVGAGRVHEVLEASDEAALETFVLGFRELGDDHAQDDNRESELVGRKIRASQALEEVGVVCVANEVDGARAVDGQNLRPDEDEGLANVLGRALEELQDVGEDSDRQGVIDRPGSHVEEASKEVQGPEPVGLRQEDLKDDGQDGRLCLLPASELKPNFKGCQLLHKESGRLVLDRVRRQHGGELGEADFNSKVPR